MQNISARDTLQWLQLTAGVPKALEHLRVLEAQRLTKQRILHATDRQLRVEFDDDSSHDGSDSSSETAADVSSAAEELIYIASFPRLTAVRVYVITVKRRNKLSAKCPNKPKALKLCNWQKRNYCNTNRFAAMAPQLKRV